MDGVDASIIRSDGESNYEPIFDKYFEYDGVIYSNLLNLRDKINSIKDLKIILIKLTSSREKLPYFMQKLAKKL